MKNKDLLRNMKLLGYPFFETEENFEANKTLAEVVKAGDLRMWEGFPVLLANSLEKGLFDERAVEKYFRAMSDKTYFRSLVTMSLALYKYLRLEFSWVHKLTASRFFDEKVFNEFLKRFMGHDDFTKDLKELSSDRVVNAFRRYFEPEKPDLKEYTQLKGEFDLEYSLSQVFSKKQKELFMKKLRGEKMTKTEREYYSRSVRKKVLALANADLHMLALKLAQQ